jgi:cytochrome c peroxidase
MKQKKIIQISFILIVTMMLFANCKKQVEVISYSDTPILPSTPFKYSLNVSSLDAVINSTIDNQFRNSTGADLNNNIVTLGRVLFYDKKLSVYNNVSCGSCHKAASGFADNIPKSNGFNTGKTIKNTPNIANEIMNSMLFWDGRSQNLSQMVLLPVSNHIEMGFEKLDILPIKLSRINYYPDLFKNAFGDNAITTNRINLAIAEFVGSIFSSTTKFDYGEQHNFSNFTNEENFGRDLFFDSLPCGSCHNISIINQNNFQSPYINFTLTDIGLDSTGIRVKVPNLRNVALSAPYMHDGRFLTLDEVINHYANNITDNIQLDRRLVFQGIAHSGMVDISNGFGMPIKMKINDNDKKALIAFLNTLTDKALLTDPKFSDPFKK